MDPDMWEMMLASMGPMAAGQSMVGMGQNPAMWGPMLDAMGLPPPGSPEEVAAMFAGGGQVGPALMGEGIPSAIPGTRMGAAGQIPGTPGGMGMVGAGPQAMMQPPQAGAGFQGQPQLGFPVPPGGGGGMAPGMGVAAASSVVPQSRMAGQNPAIAKPGAEKDPKFAGGIPGTPKPNEGLGVKGAGMMTPAQAFMQAMLGSRGGNPLRVPPLGTMWG